VVRLDAGAVSTQVVDLGAVRYFSHESRVRETVAAHLDTAYLDVRISILASAAGQVPAILRLVQCREKTRNERLNLLSRHRHTHHDAF
jgi:hypothetical protein